MTESIIFWCLTFAFFYLLITSVILIRNRFELTALPQAASPDEPELKQKISVCIPARNEEKTLPVLLPTLLQQEYERFEVLVLNDSSEDHTASVLDSFRIQSPETLKVFDGSKKPDDWLGKPWACMQLGGHAAENSDILLFLDADTQLHPGALQGIAHAFQKYDADMITVWPQQILGSFWEKTVIPLIYYGLVTILPSIYVHRKPRWMPKFLYVRLSSRFAAANGQCIAFKKECYRKIGGHQPVKSAIVEDVELAKEVKKAGLTVRMFHGVGSVSCRMYETSSELFSGLRKNFFAGFGNSLSLFITAAILHLVVFILPLAGLIYSIMTPDGLLFFISVACLSIILIHRLLLAIWFKWDPLYAFTHPIGVLWFQWLGLVKIYDYLTGHKSTWKGRQV